MNTKELTRKNRNDIRYAQCWEDPATLRQALAVNSKDNVLSIASGGDNTFALLLDNPKSIVAIDSNPSQIFLVELKMRALQVRDYEDFLGFLGVRAWPIRARLYSFVQPNLTASARGYWDANMRIMKKGIVHCGKFERYFELFRRAVLPLIHDKREILQLLNGSSARSQKRFYDEVWDNWRWRVLFRVFFGKFLLGRIGRDASYFRYVKLDGIADELLRRTRRGFTEVPLHSNYFVEYILTGRFSDCLNLHPYLQPSNFELLKSRVNKVRLVIGCVEDYLRGLPPNAISKFNLSDIFEYMSEEAVETLLRSIAQASLDNARLLFWTLFVPRGVPLSLRDCIEPVTQLSNELYAQTRTFFYGSVALWRKRKNSSGKTSSIFPEQ